MACVPQSLMLCPNVIFWLDLLRVLRSSVAKRPRDPISLICVQLEEKEEEETLARPPARQPPPHSGVLSLHSPPSADAESKSADRVRMHQHLTPQRLVESQAGGSVAMPSRNEGDDAAGKADAARIPRLFPSSSAFPMHSQQQQQQYQRQQGLFQQPHSAFPHRSAADIMLGLKTLATHADRQVPILNHDSNPMPTFPSLRVSSSQSSGFTAQRMALNTAPGLFPPAITTAAEDQRRGNPHASALQPTEDSAGENKVSPVHFGEYLSRKNKRGESRMADNATSPTSRSQTYNSDREITLSPPSTAVPGPRILPVATTIAWRSSSSIFSPNSKRYRPSPVLSAQNESKAPFTLAPLEPQRSTLPISTLTRSTSGPATTGGPAATAAMAKQPVLVRKVSSKWRDELEDHDRRKSRERIQRGLIKHAEGDYDVLLLIIAAMEEELLHIKTTSKDHYFQQAQALSAEIQHASLER